MTCSPGPAAPGYWGAAAEPPCALPLPALAPGALSFVLHLDVHLGEIIAR